MSWAGDYALETTFDFKFTTRQFSDGVPTTLSGTPVVDIYEDNSVTQITGAETLTVDFDSVTGLNNLRIAATAANGFESGKSYAAVITTGTVGGTSVVGEVVCNFSIERTSALRPTTAGRTLDVTTTGGAGIDWGNVENQGTTVDLSATDIQLVDTCTTNTDMRGTDNAALASVLGALADAAAAGDPTSADTVMQYIKQLVNVLVGTTGVTTFPAAAAPANNVSLAEIIRSIYDDTNAIDGNTSGLTFTVANQVDANMIAISGDSAAADQLEESATTIVFGTAQTGTLSTTQMTTNLAETTDDHYIGRTVIWVTGALADQASDITDYAGSGGLLTFSTVTEAPSNGDTFVIV